MAAMTEQRKAATHDLFKLFDLDNSGSISLEELKQVGPVFNPTWTNITAVFDDMDLDHNGRVSLQEFQAFLADHTKSMSDGDFDRFALTTSRVIKATQFTPIEVPEKLVNSAKRQETAHELFRMFDLDRNGSVSLEELKRVGPVLVPDWKDAEVAAAVFEAMDKDHNGNVSDDEFVAFFITHTYDMSDAQFDVFALSVERMVKAFAPVPEASAEVEGMEGLEYDPDLPEVVNARRKSAVDELFKLFDLDQNGSLSLEELKEVGPVFDPAWADADVAAAAFNDMDLDHNGRVSKQEFLAFMAAHTKGMSDSNFDRFLLTTKRMIKASQFTVPEVTVEDKVASAAKKGAVAKEIFEMFDLDHNGSLSLDELKQVGPVFVAAWRDPEVAAAVFDAMDKDHNGNIDLDEFRTFFLTHTYEMSAHQFDVFALSVVRMLKAHQFTPPAEQTDTDSIEYDPDLPEVVSSRRKAAVHDLFKLFDLDHSGALDLAELKQVGPVFNPAWSDEEAVTQGFNDMDLDHNGRVSEQEFMTFMAAHTKHMSDACFSRFTLTTTRMIKAHQFTAVEAPSGIADVAKRRSTALDIFNLFDLDHNGSISLEELKQVGPVFNPAWRSEYECALAFDAIDADRNGKITDDEFQAFFLTHTHDMTDDQFQIFALSLTRMVKALAPEPAHPEFAFTSDLADGVVFFPDLPAETQARRRASVGDLFQLFDQNQDGHISMTEFMEVGPVFNPAWSNADAITQAFAAMDLDQNGFISQNEFTAFLANHTQQMSDSQFDAFSLSTSRMIKACLM